MDCRPYFQEFSLYFSSFLFFFSSSFFSFLSFLSFTATSLLKILVSRLLKFLPICKLFLSPVTKITRANSDARKIARNFIIRLDYFSIARFPLRSVAPRTNTSNVLSFVRDYLFEANHLSPTLFRASLRMLKRLPRSLTERVPIEEITVIRLFIATMTMESVRADSPTKICDFD